jgi:NTE family protein
MIPPRYLVISGGGVKVISIVGVIKALNEKKMLKNLKEVSGVSAGSWLAFMLAAGLSIQAIESVALNFEFGLLRNVTPDAILGFPETFGVDDGKSLHKFLESILRVVVKVSPTITFSEFYSLKLSTIGFRCWATDLKEHRVREFSYEKTPDVKIIDAIRASMSLPLYFVPVTDPITGNTLSDGGIQGNLPLHLLSENEVNDCMGIGFAHNSEKKDPDDLMSFINCIFDCLIHSDYENVLRKYSHKIIRVPIFDVNSWNFEISRDIRKLLIDRGFDTGKEWLANVKSGSRSIIRRHSVQ